MEFGESHETTILMPRAEDHDTETSRRKGKGVVNPNLEDSDENIFTSMPQSTGNVELTTTQGQGASTSASASASASALSHKHKSRCSMDSPDETATTETNAEAEHDHEDLPEDYYNLLRYSRWTVLLHLTTFVSVLALLTLTLTLPVLKGVHLFRLRLWKWVVMVLVVVFGQPISGWVVNIILVLFIQPNYILRKRVLYFAYGLKGWFQHCLWLALTLTAWKCTFDEQLVDRMGKGHVALRYLTRILVCLLVGAVVCLVKALVTKVLLSSYHATIFLDRVQGYLFSLYVINALSGPPKEDRLIRDQIETPGLRANFIYTSAEAIGRMNRWTQKNISAWNLKRLMDVVLTGQLEGALKVSSEADAKDKAKKIANNVCKLGSSRIYLGDLKRFLSDDEASKFISLFDGETATKGINKGVFENWAVHVFQDRKFLVLSLTDVNTAVNKLHWILNIVVGILIFVFCLLILRIVHPHYLIVIYTELVLTAFVFGNMCKTAFEAILFLFLVHPYDVGDRCEVDGVQMTVEKMNILTTDFTKMDNQKATYHNSVLATKLITNYNRSPDLEDTIDLCIHVRTPRERIVQMEEAITSYIDSHSDHWHPSPDITVRDGEELDRLKVSIRPTHRSNYQDLKERRKCRSDLIKAMVQVCKDLDIEEYCEPKVVTNTS